MFRNFDDSLIPHDLNIVINTRMLLKNKLEGIGGFIFESFRRIAVQHPEHHFYFLFDRKWAPEFIFSSNVTPVWVPPQARHPYLMKIWYELSIPIVLKKLKADLFVSPDALMSLHTSCPTLVVIHDLNFEHYPNDLPGSVRRLYCNNTPKFAKKAVKIATVSEYSKTDIIANYGVSPEKIDVVYSGANDKLRPVDDSVKHSIRLQFSEGNPYFVFVGSLHPRKNLANLFRAFDKFCIDNKTLTYNLLIVGERRWWTPAIQEAYNSMAYQQRVKFTGRVSNENLWKIVASASVLTYVSNFEGFGVPIIEGFKCGIPVLTSTVTSMPEIAGDAALLVNPASTDSISAGMKQLAIDERLRTDLIEKGFKRAQFFTWDLTAELLWNSIEKTLQKL